MSQPLEALAGGVDRTSSRLARRLRDVAREEGGIAIVYVLVVLVLVLAFGTAVLAETISARHLASYNGRQQRAQQAADAGVQSQLYLAEQNNFASPYNFGGGVLGVSGFLDCVVPQFNASGQITGVTLLASSAGVCPQFQGIAGTAMWRAVGNHAYEADEYLSNKQEVGGSGFGAVVEFPQIVSVGCDATTVSTCGGSASSNVYARELLLLQPTGPLQALEGMGNVTINALSALNLGAVTVNGDIAAGGTLTWPTLAAALNVGNVPPSTSVSTFAASTFGATNGVTTARKVTLTGPFCATGSPSTACIVKRPAPTTATTNCSGCTTGITCSSCNANYYSSSTGAFNLTSGTATFSPGDYAFCNFSAAAGSTVNVSPTASSPVRIFILSPSQSPCRSGQGNLTASSGLNNTLTGTVNGVSGALDPSGLQIYVSGDGSYDNATNVTVGDGYSCTQYSLSVCKAATAPTEAMIIYAPTSSVTVNTGTCVVSVAGTCTLGVAGAFAGNIIGDNVSITASTITQDLDLANAPLYSGTNAAQPAQYVHCSTSVTSLAGASSDTNGC